MILDTLTPSQRATYDSYWKGMARGQEWGQGDIARDTGLKKGTVGSCLKMLRRTFDESGKPLVPPRKPGANRPDGLKEPPKKPGPQPERSYSEDGNTAQLATVIDREPRSLDDLLQACNIDPEEWHVESWTANVWEVGAKVGDSESQQLVAMPLYQVKAKLVRKVARAIVTEIPPLQPAHINVKPHKTKPLKADGMRRCVVVPDIHVGFARDFGSGVHNPFHDRRVVDVYLQTIRQVRPHRVVILGDLLDLPDFSDKYLCSPEFYHTFQPTLYEAGWILSQIRAAAPEAEIDFLPGNHDDRIRKAVISHTISLYKIRPANQPPDAPEVLSLTNLLGLHRLKITEHEDYPKGKVWLNRWLALRHGNEVGAKSGSTTGKTLAEGKAHSEGYGHIHRVESATRTSHEFDGPAYYTAASFGCGVLIPGPIPGNSPTHNWQNGVGVIYYEPDSPFRSIDTVHIQDGRCVLHGSILEGQDYAAQMAADLRKHWNYGEAA